MVKPMANQPVIACCTPGELGLQGHQLHAHGVEAGLAEEHLWDVWRPIETVDIFIARFQIIFRRVKYEYKYE